MQAIGKQKSTQTLLLIGAWLLLLPAIAEASPIVDKFQCAISVGQGSSNTVNLNAVRNIDDNTAEQMIYETPGTDLTSDLKLPSGLEVELEAQYTFKRQETTPDSWGLHTCMSGFVKDEAGHITTWACPEMYFPVAQENDVPAFAKGQSLEHTLAIDGKTIKLSCTHVESLY